MAVAEQDGPVTGPVVDQLTALDGPLAAALGPLDVHRERLEVTQVVRDAVGEHPTGAFMQLAGAGENGGELFEEGRSATGGGRHAGLSGNEGQGV
jgi:hypothetical protein